jgi:hypothetical protein
MIPIIEQTWKVAKPSGRLPHALKMTDTKPYQNILLGRTFGAYEGQKCDIDTSMRDKFGQASHGHDIYALEAQHQLVVGRWVELDAVLFRIRDKVTVNEEGSTICAMYS